MSVHSLKSVQQIPATLEAAWNFFSLSHNLATITPPHLNFRVRSHHHGSRIYAGQIIEYTVSPLFGIPLYWMTEITHVQEQVLFVDEQRYGPYAMWHHQHHFREVEGGVEMTDIVHYKNPFWFIGDVANTLVVKKQLKKIFSSRYQKITELFGAVKGQQEEIEFF
jgi:ligand-binding SRPBCC domain-containing protein